MAAEPSNGGPRRLTATRIVVWIVVGGLGIYLVVAGVVGILAKS